MIDFTIFYSWQSDSPPEANRTFIEKALRDAVKAICEERSMADLPVVDLGMNRVAGSPEVATIMFRKISRSAVFLGDVSLVSEVKKLIPNKERKLAANPNVLIEMGYAAAYLGWERVICVMNEHYGKAEEQPVDVRNRRFPIDYDLNPEALNGADRIKKQLIRDIKRAIEVVDACDHESADDAVKTMNVYCLRLLERYGNSEQIFPGNHETRGDVVDNLFWEEAIMHLLRINVLQCAPSPNNPREFSYYWTHLGKVVVVADEDTKWPPSRQLQWSGATGRIRMASQLTPPTEPGRSSAVGTYRPTFVWSDGTDDGRLCANGTNGDRPGQRPGLAPPKKSLAPTGQTASASVPLFALPLNYLSEDDSNGT